MPMPISYRFLNAYLEYSPASSIVIHVTVDVERPRAARVDLKDSAGRVTRVVVILACGGNSVVMSRFEINTRTKSYVSYATIIYQNPGFHAV